MSQKKHALAFAILLAVIYSAGAQSYLDNVVRIETKDITGEFSLTGTGLVVGQNDAELYVVTAYHLVQDAKQVAVFFSHGGGRSFEARLLPNNINPEADLAVLTVIVDRRLLGFQAIKMIDPFTIKEGLGVIMIGNPGQGQQNWEINTRNYTSKLTNPKGIFSVSNDGIAAGFSGGPVFNKKKHLMGIILERNAIEVKVLDIKQIVFQLQDWGIDQNYIRAYKRQINSWTLPLSGISLASLGLGLYTQNDIEKKYAIYQRFLDPTAPAYTNPSYPDYIGIQRREDVLPTLRRRRVAFQYGAYAFSGLLAATAIWVNVKPRKSPYRFSNISMMPEFMYSADKGALDIHMSMFIRF